MLSHTRMLIRATAMKGIAKSQNAAAPAVSAGSKRRFLRSEVSDEWSGLSRQLTIVVVFILGDQFTL